jgi:PAS domain S-box-containing protein
MDDFGSGYSSLNMLRSTNMDVIKLDAQFLHFRPGEERKGINILESVINMTKSLSTPIIVEGVDTKELVLYLTDMGCRYMQGFYFYRPMPGEQFEKLLKNPDRIDYGGIRQPIHEQMHIREFMDDSIYSDAMLNNILGPVAFYALRDRNVDITRFNQQFFRLLGIEPEVLEERRYGIQEFFHPDDRDKFFDMLEEAKRNRISGNSGFFRIFKPDGSLVWLEVQAYYLREQDGASLFYGSVRDRTEMLYVNNDLPGGYFRCTPKDGFRFLYVSEGFRSLFGYTGDELKIRFDSKLINMIHPDDRDRVQRESDALAAAKRERIAPYRIRNADGEYRYVIDQSRYTETFGQPCFQTVLIDVTEVMTLRNRMRLLEKYATDCILFLRDLQDSSTMEMVVYGLKNAVGIDGDSFLRQLRNQEIRITSMQGDSLDTQIMKYREDLTRANGLYTLRIPDGKEIRVHVRFSLIPDGEEETVCIVTLTPATV